MPQQFFFRLEHIGDRVWTKGVVGHKCLRNRTFGFFLGQAAEVRSHRVHSSCIQLQLQRVRLR